MNTTQTLLIADFVNTMYGAWECIDPQIDEMDHGVSVGVFNPKQESEGYILIDNGVLTVILCNWQKGKSEYFTFVCSDAMIVPTLNRVLPDLFGR